MRYMNKKNRPSRFSGDPAYEALEPEVQEAVDYLDENYDDPLKIAENMLAYIEKYKNVN